MLNGATLRDAIISGANAVSNRKNSVDELNVFPVPDGDTGTNMSMTINAAVGELASLADDCTVEKAANTAAAAMLRGARGNSGVILSLLFRGISKAVAGKKEIDGAELANALAQGVAAAYKAVMKPTEGTILTVSRVAAEKAIESGEKDVIKVWTTVLEQAKITLDETPELLPVLKKAGVVDAGGMGFCIICEGMLSVFKGEGIVEVGAVQEKTTGSNYAAKGIFSNEDFEITFNYCTEFLVNKADGSNAMKLRAFLESVGDSVVIVDDDEIIKAHVHTDDPGKVLTKAIEHGVLSRIKIENMEEQYAARKAQGKSLEKEANAMQNPSESGFNYCAVDVETEYGFVAIAAGKGLENMFKDLGANAIVTGGQTMNPSTNDILNAIHSVGAKTVFVLPNNKNIIMAAEQAQKLADRKVIVLPTRTIPQGMTAMLVFDETKDTETNAIAMREAFDKVATGLITFAARDSEFDGKKIKKGEILAMDGSKLAFTDKDISKATVRLAKSLVKKDTQFVTVISGEDIDEAEAERCTEQIRAKIGSKSAEVTHLRGDQPVYYYMLSVE